MIHHMFEKQFLDTKYSDSTLLDNTRYMFRCDPGVTTGAPFTNRIALVWFTSNSTKNRVKSPLTATPPWRLKLEKLARNGVTPLGGCLDHVGLSQNAPGTWRTPRGDLFRALVINAPGVPKRMGVSYHSDL